jgi:hypothetical protein
MPLKPFAHFPGNLIFPVSSEMAIPFLMSDDSSTPSHVARGTGYRVLSFGLIAGVKPSGRGDSIHTAFDYDSGHAAGFRAK